MGGGRPGRAGRSPGVRRALCPGLPGLPHHQRLPVLSQSRPVRGLADPFSAASPPALEEPAGVERRLFPRCRAVFGGHAAGRVGAGRTALADRHGHRRGELEPRPRRRLHRGRGLSGTGGLASAPPGTGGRRPRQPGSVVAGAGSSPARRQVPSQRPAAGSPAGATRFPRLGPLPQRRDLLHRRGPCHRLPAHRRGASDRRDPLRRWDGDALPGAGVGLPLPGALLLRKGGRVF